MKKIKLGDNVKHKLSKYKGTVTAITEFLQGCRRIGVKSKELHEGKPIEACWFDEPELDIVKKKRVIKKTPGDNGGPMSEIPTMAKDPTGL